MATRSTLSIVKVGANVVVSWANGVAPFQLQKTNSLDTIAWQNIGNPTMGRSKTLPTEGEAGYFRVQEGIPLLDVDLSNPNAVRLVWQVPDLT